MATGGLRWKDGGRYGTYETREDTVVQCSLSLLDSSRSWTPTVSSGVTLFISPVTGIMANLIRSAKSGSDWRQNELVAFNITIQNVDVQTFFGVAQLPQTTVSTVILNNVVAPRIRLLPMFSPKTNSTSSSISTVLSTLSSAAWMILLATFFECSTSTTLVDHLSSKQSCHRDVWPNCLRNARLCSRGRLRVFGSRR